MKPYMSTKPTLLQNALYFPVQDYYMPSTHVHDYRVFEYLPGCEAMVDGGREYIRRNVTPLDHAHLVVDWSLYSDSPRDAILDRLLWGSLPLDKTKPQIHTHRPIRLLTKDHLQAIWDNVPNIAPLHRSVIAHWLALP